MEVSVQFSPIELARLEKRLNETGQAVGLTVQWLCWDQARLAALDGIKYVAPWAAGKPGSGMAQRKQGESAVSNDIDRLFARKDDDKYVIFTNKGNGKKYAKNKEKGIVFEIPTELIDVDPKQYHLSKRNNRGRVAKQKRQAWITTDKINKYIKEVQARVGSLKASWLPALENFAVKVHGKARVSAWITRQKREGSYIDAMNADGNGKIVVTSAAHHGQAIRRDTVMFMQRRRNQSMAKYTPKRIQQIVDQFNANRTNVQPIRQNAPE